MRRLNGLCVGAFLAPMTGALLSCASQGAPPGGAPDIKAPELVRLTPDSNATNVRPKSVVFRFDEVVSERPQGVATLGSLFIVSPSDGSPNVTWHRSAIDVRPRRGFKQNAVYTITMLPGLADLRGNAIKVPISLLFSTGSVIPNTVLSGIVFDWVAGRPAPGAFIEAIARDSTRYIGIADSAGDFSLRHIPPGAYTVRATLDQNGNRLLDPREAWDSVRVSLADSTRLELLSFIHDTVGPRIATVTVRDSFTLRVEMDKPLDPQQALDTSRFALFRPDSQRVPLVLVRPARVWERDAAEREQRKADSVARADTSRRAARDSAAQDSAAKAAARPAPRTDSTIAVPIPSRPLPINELILQVADPLKPGTAYRMRAIGLRNLAGATRTSERLFSTPKAKPPAVPAATPPIVPKPPVRPPPLQQ